MTDRWTGAVLLAALLAAGPSAAVGGLPAPPASDPAGPVVALSAPAPGPDPGRGPAGRPVLLDRPFFLVPPPPPERPLPPLAAAQNDPAPSDPPAPGEGDAGAGIPPGGIEAAEGAPAGEAPPGEEASGEGGDAEPPAPTVADPIEPVNRVLFVVNDKAYFWVLKPVAEAYEKAVPRKARLSVGNFLANLAMPVRFVGHLLQGKVKGAGKECARFVINSTLGVAGLFDVAQEKFGLAGHDEDLGQAFASWGLGHGFYLVIPFLGPSSLRDAAGLAGDAFVIDPLNYFGNVYTVIAARAVKQETTLSLRLGAYEALVEDAVDPYAAVRDAYVQYRAKEARE